MMSILRGFKVTFSLIGHFRVASVSKRVLVHNLSNGNEFDLQDNEHGSKLIFI